MPDICSNLNGHPSAAIVLKQTEPMHTRGALRHRLMKLCKAADVPASVRIAFAG